MLAEEFTSTTVVPVEAVPVEAVLPASDKSPHKSDEKYKEVARQAALEVISAFEGSEIPVHIVAAQVDKAVQIALRRDRNTHRMKKVRNGKKEKANRALLEGLGVLTAAQPFSHLSPLSSPLQMPPSQHSASSQLSPCSPLGAFNMDSMWSMP